VITDAAASGLNLNPLAALAPVASEIALNSFFEWKPIS